jgi:hypothetical protein
MPEPKDDFAAVRSIAETLTGFDPNDQERIIRWAREKIGLAVAPEMPSTPWPAGSPAGSPPSGAATSAQKDLKTFVGEKKPKNDVQFAATVAYYYRFVAPPDQRKNEITSTDLQEGCRLVGRERFTVPGQTLRNAHTLGLLNRGSQTGSYTINSVGENLVDVTLPGDSAGIPRTKMKKKKKKKKKSAKKATRNSPKK